MRLSLLALAVIAASASPAAAQAPAAAPAPTSSPVPATFRCSASIMVEESPTAPPGTRAMPGRSEHRFLAVDFFEGECGDRSGALAPVNRCTLVFAYNERTGAVGTPQRPQTVECR